MPRTNFEQLRVYQFSEELSDAIWDIVCKWDGFAKDTVGKQVVRSADSVGANIAEGEGRGSYQDNRREGHYRKLSIGCAGHISGIC